MHYFVLVSGVYIAQQRVKEMQAEELHLQDIVCIKGNNIETSNVCFMLI